MELTRTHTRHHLYYHVVWATKNRESLISHQVEAALYPFLLAKSKEAGGGVLALNGVADHVHLVVQLAPKQTLAKFVKDLKGSSSHFLNHGAGIFQEFKWQSGYGAFSVSERDLSSVIQYVKWQKKHHEEATTVPNWEPNSAAPE